MTVDSAPAESAAGASSCGICGIPLVSSRVARTVGVPDGHRRHHGRRLCSLCYYSARRANTLIDHERSIHTRDEVVEEWVFLRRRGHTVGDIARRLGMPRKSLERSIGRARKAGDPRVPALAPAGRAS